MAQELTTYSYAAGVIDSDGCIQIMQRRNENKNYYSLRVSVSQVTESIPLWFIRNFGGRVSKFYSSKERRQPVFRWELESNKASGFLQKVLPYLVEKIERAKLGIEFQATLIYKGFADKLTIDVIEKRTSFYEQMKVLNAKNSREHWKNHINLNFKSEVV